jgi:DNA topoisomerase-2
MSKVSENTQYLHGEQSLYGVIVGMAQDFIDSNNIPYFKREGSFGNRLIKDAAASRYIFTCKESYLDLIFRKEDVPLIGNQFFEGDKIEPSFYVPVIPMLLVNGSIGLTTGFMQKILQRNPEELIKWILAKLDNKKFNGKLLPWYKGYKGTIKQGTENNSFIIEGHYNKINNNTIEIDELPVGYDLAQYINVLDQLVEDKKIKDYNDYSENGEFKFKITFFRNQGLDINNDDLISELKLYKTYSEIYTSLNENNQVIEYNSPIEILENYYKIRYEFYIKRKQYLIKELESTIRLIASKYVFIKSVIDGELEIRNKSNEYICNKLDNMKNIIKQKDSYDYLLNMPMSSITKEKYMKMKEQLLELKNQYKDLVAISVEDMWKKDLKELMLELKKI